MFYEKDSFQTKVFQTYSKLSYAYVIKVEFDSLEPFSMTTQILCFTAMCLKNIAVFTAKQVRVSSVNKVSLKAKFKGGPLDRRA